MNDPEIAEEKRMITWKIDNRDKGGREKIPFLEMQFTLSLKYIGYGKNSFYTKNVEMNLFSEYFKNYRSFFNDS